MNDGGGGQFGAPCVACKHLRQKCTPSCIFAPYFPSDEIFSEQIFATLLETYNHKQMEQLLRELPKVEDPTTPNFMSFHFMPIVDALTSEIRHCHNRINVLHRLLTFILFLGEMRIINAHLDVLEMAHYFSREPNKRITPAMIKGKSKQGFDLNQDRNS